MSDRAGEAGSKLASGDEEAREVRTSTAANREWARIPVRISTIDPKTDPGSGYPYFVTAEECSANVSKSGAFVLTEEALDPESRLIVELDLPDGPTIQRLARVVWNRIAIQGVDSQPNRRPGIGIEFIGGRIDHVQEYERYLTRTDRPRPVSVDVTQGRHRST